MSWDNLFKCFLNWDLPKLTYAKPMVCLSGSLWSQCSWLEYVSLCFSLRLNLPNPSYPMPELITAEPDHVLLAGTQVFA